MTRRKHLGDRPIPAHPYRDTALVYGIMAVLLVGVAALTGGDVIRATLVAGIFFVVATTWTCWRFRGRIRERDAASAAVTPQRSGGRSANGNGRGGTGA